MPRRDRAPVGRPPRVSVILPTFDRMRVDFSDLRYAVGIGLRFVTPAGALVADLGWNPKPRSGEHPLEFHLSVGFPF